MRIGFVKRIFNSSFDSYEKGVSLVFTTRPASKCDVGC